MLHLTYLIILLPLVGFAVQLVAGRRLGDPLAGAVATAFVFASFVISCIVFVGLLHVNAPVRSFNQNLWTWIPVSGLQVHAALYVDPLSMTMVLFVTGISSLIHLYSIGYMKGDRDYPKFFVYLNLFVASMLILVLGANMVVTFVGWEGVGACSYWLVAFWFTREAAASAGKKAFIYNRVGDVGFLLAMFLAYESTGSFNYQVIFSKIPQMSGSTITAIALLLFLAAAGKSAQIPLFPWLADAMEGPTPVSALIHAATMVTAGVYLMCRVNPLLHASSSAALTVAIVGAATALVAATMATAQNDIKKVLAFSTVSQLGYMFLAIGCGAYEAAIFLMVMHAFFKAVLFLGAGSVIHGLHDEQDLKRMGALRHVMVLTFVTFGVGWLAIAGIPPLSGFWAKGDVLDNAWAVHPALWAVGVITAFLTAYYMSRLGALAFFGKGRWELDEPIDPGEPGYHAEHYPIPTPHEPGWTMKLPLIVLAVLAAAGGILSLPWTQRHTYLKWVDPVFGSDLYPFHESTRVQWGLSTLDAVIAVLGVSVAMFVWVRSAEHRSLESTFFKREWYVNELYDTTIGRPGAQLAQFAAGPIDTGVIDGAVNGVASLVRRSGSAVRRLQTGYVRNYVLAIVLGLVLIVGFMVTRLWWPA